MQHFALKQPRAAGELWGTVPPPSPTGLRRRGTVPSKVGGPGQRDVARTVYTPVFSEEIDRRWGLPRPPTITHHRQCFHSKSIAWGLPRPPPTTATTHHHPANPNHPPSRNPGPLSRNPGPWHGRDGRARQSSANGAVVLSHAGEGVRANPPSPPPCRWGFGRQPSTPTLLEGCLAKN